MNMINIISFFSGCIITSILFLISRKKKKEKILRKGLLKNKFQAKTARGEEEFEASIEIAEIDSTDTKSKIKVLEIISSKSVYNSTEWKIKIKGLIDNTWINSSDIEWVYKSKSTERAEKLDKILN